MLILGIETSCDETAAAIVRGDAPKGKRVTSEIVLSQQDHHRPFGGVVPEVAARAHLDHIDDVVGDVMETGGISFQDLDAVACTGGPGLIGGLIVGVMTAKAICLVHNKPLLCVNHLEGHALTARLSDDTSFPYLLLLVSGGHCQILAVEAVGHYRRFGTTIDDAAGEAFDKVARMLGLDYPGGPAVQVAAESGDPGRFDLPRPMKGRPGCDFSFSGLKTSVRQTLAKLPSPLSHRDVHDLAASFQAALVDAIADRMTAAVRRFRHEYPSGTTLVAAGGVAANAPLRARLSTIAASSGMVFVAPPARWCSDNAAMIAWAGGERFVVGTFDALDFEPRPRWPLDATADLAHGMPAL